MIKKPLRSILVLLTIGTFVSARQVASRTGAGQNWACSRTGGVESVFLAHDGCIDLPGLAQASGSLLAFSTRTSLTDTLETYEIELPPEKKTALNAKTAASYLIVAFFVGYALYLFLGSGERDKPADGGKDKPDGPLGSASLSR